MKEKVKANESVILKDVLLEYEEVIKAAKEKLAENNSKELNGLIEKFLKESANKNEPFNKAGKEVRESTSIQQPIGETVKEGFDAQAINMKEASLSEVEAAFDSANADDEFQVVRSTDQQVPADGIGNEFDLTAIEGEIDEMMQQVNQAEMQMQQNNQPAAPAATSAVVATPVVSDPMSKMKEMYEGMGKFIKEMEDMSNNQAMMNEFHSKMTEMYGDGYKAQMDEAKITELFSMYKKVKSGNAGEPTSKMNETAPATPVVPVAEETAPAAAAPAVEESHGISLSHNKLTGQEQQPRIENGKEYAANKIRVGLQNESTQKKMTALLKENQNLMKQLNKSKSALAESKTKSTTEVDALKKLNETSNATLEKYKGALEKYREQLKEMAVLNTNISYVNSLFLSENLNLTMKDKEEIIEKFKKIGTIVESEQTYKAVLKTLTESKQAIKASIEDKVNSTIVESSSSRELEKTLNESTAESEHIKKILKYSGVK